jgi:beta-glucosidase
MTGDAFRNPQLSTRERARDLLQRLSADERLALLHQVVPPIERLGIGGFRTGTEALHGVAWLGTATVFPQAVGLAATWDADLLRRVGEVTSVEVRAKRAADPSVSLNVWAPVVNTLRHPAWGRTEEGYSEDPHLTAHFATAYCRGLRGDHPTVWRTVPTLKHFLGYSNETDRSTTSSELSARTLHEEELPAFREPLETGVAGAMMLAYNRVNGAPAHTQPELVDEARSWSTESIAVVSDAGAPTFLVSVQEAHADAAAAAGALVASGLDSFTDHGDDAEPSLTAVREAMARGLIDAADVDRAALRMLELRVRTGEFDGEHDPYGDIAADRIDTPQARELAREAVGSSVVVLRNDDEVLPLVEPRSVAVVGPLADIVLTDWYSGTPPYAVDVASAVRERWPAAQVRVATGGDTVVLRSTTTGALVATDASGDRVAARASDPADESAHFTVTDWGDGLLTLRSKASGRLLTGAAWPMRADADRVGGWVVQESFERHPHPDGTVSFLHRGSGRWVRVMRQSGLLAAEAVTMGDAERFHEQVLVRGLDEVAAAADAAEVTIVVLGNDPHLSGRETEDRPHLDIADSAARVWRAASERCARTVTALVSSYPYVLADLDDARTLVWSSHGGQELGHGLVDILAGDREPRGRLAQSWPMDAAQCGDLFDYDTARQQATYRHQPQPFAFALGHGLTYTSVDYLSLALSSTGVAAPAPTRRHPFFTPRADQAQITARVRVRNTGGRPADELVQLYVRPSRELPLPAPLNLLVAYRRVRVEPGQTREVELAFALDRLAVWDEAAGSLRVQPGTYEVCAGTSAAHVGASVVLTVS